VSLAGFQAFLFDLDGCVYLDETLIEGADRFIATLRARGHRVFFLTNNSAMSAQEVAGRLTRLGIPTPPTQVMTATDATATYLHETLGPSRVLVLGARSLAEGLAAQGHTVLPMREYRQAQAVVVGRDLDLTYERLTQAARAVDAGALFVGCNLDRKYPIPEADGGFIPGAAAIVEAVAACVQQRPVIIGKPSPLMFRLALARLGCAPAEAAMVGDSPATDIAGGRAAGLFTVLYARTPPGPFAPEEEPHLIVRSFAEALALLGEPAASPEAAGPRGAVQPARPAASGTCAPA
jgi:HAD superfamily hydrolase (TIGR01450 family)